MKKLINYVMALVAVVTFASCGGMMGGSMLLPNQQTQSTTQSAIGSLIGIGQQSTAGSQGFLGSLLSGLIGQAVPLSAESMYGTWNYSSPECRFESENFLSQAGGEMAASTIEGKLAESFAKFGISQGTCQFVFAQGNVCVINIAGRQIQGTFTVNSSTHEFRFTSQTGLLSFTAYAYIGVGELTLLFDTNKLLTFAQGVGALTGKANATAGTLSTLVSSYKGMKLGINLRK